MKRSKSGTVACRLFQAAAHLFVWMGLPVSNAQADAKSALLQLRTFCRSLGAHVREVQDGASFTAMLWEDADSVSERDAAEIQRKIKRKTAEYPGFVCYCFDAFSTLIYRI